jgi:hypothetical protein
MTTARVFQRPDWDGVPRQLDAWWTLTKGPHRATCQMFTHLFGFELRLIVKQQLVESRVCRTDAEILHTQEQWRTAMQAKGWQ